MAVGEEETKRGSASTARGAPADLAGADEAASALVFRSFLMAMRLHRQLMIKTLLARGAHAGQAICLRLVAAHDGITQRDMAETLTLARPTVSRMLRAMEKGGMVERRPDTTDQRLTRVYLTSAGRDRERELRAVAADYVQQTIGTLSSDDRRELARLLDKLVEGMSTALAGHDDGPAGQTAGRAATVDGWEQQT